MYGSKSKPKPVKNMARVSKDTTTTKTKKTTGKNGVKITSRASSTPRPKALPKNPTLDDFLSRGMKPPTRNKKGQKRPSDADVRIKGFNA